MSDALTEKLVVLIQKIFWPVVGLAVVAIVASFALTFKKNQDLKKLTKAQDELFLIRKDAEKMAASFEPKEESKSPTAKTPPAKAPAKPSGETLEKSYGPLVEKLKVFISANQGTTAAVEGALLVAELTQEYNKPELALEPLQKSLDGVPQDLFLFAVGQTELGNVAAKINKCAEAVQAWEKVIAVKEHSYMAGNLRLKAGVCYEKQAQFEKAEKMYQEVVDLEPNSFSGRTAKKFLLHLRYLKSKSAATADVPRSQNG